MYGLIESLSELLRIPSISGNEKECKRALDFLLEVGNDFGFKTGRAADGKVGYIEIGKGWKTESFEQQKKIAQYVIDKIGRAHV